MAGEKTTAELQIKLDASTVDSGAESAAQALEALRASIKADSGEIAQMQRALKNLEGGTKVSIKQVYGLKDAIAAKKQALAEAQSGFVKLGGSFKTAGKAAKQPADAIAAMKKRLEGMKEATKDGIDKDESFKALADQAGKLPGPLGDILGKIGNLKTAFAGANVGALAMSVGLTALVAATVAAIGKLTLYGIAQGDARRSELLRMEGMTKMRNYYGLAAGNAKEMQTAIDRVAASSSASRSEIASYSDELYTMGLRGDNLSQALEGVAIKSTVQGAAAAHAFAGWAAGAALTGQSVKKLADNVKSRLGGIAQKQMASLTVQAMKQKESFDALFDDLDVEKFVTAKKTVGDLLSQTTNSGKAIKALMTSLVQPIVNMATQAQPLIKRFFQGMIQSALELQIAYLTIKIAFKRAFVGLGGQTKDADKLNVALGTGKVVMYLLATALGVATVAAIAFAWPVLLAGAAIWALFEIASNFMQVWDEIDWPMLGMSILNGILDTLALGPNLIGGAMESLGKAAWTSFKDALGIHSPSTVFAKLGLAIPEGLGAGVEAGTPTAQGAVDAMLDVPRMPGGDGSAASHGGDVAAGKVSGDTILNFGDIYLSGGKDGGGKSLANDFVGELSRILEGVSIQLGASNVGEAA